MSSTPTETQQESAVPAVYFGGSRHLGNLPIVAEAVRAVIYSGCLVHVGCQAGADQAVIEHCIYALSARRLSVFVVASHHSKAPAHVIRAGSAGARVVFSAGGPETIPEPARYLRRSIAAFQGCGQAVFFQPGPGSLAVARECVRSGVRVFAFNPTPGLKQFAPAAIPETAGSWQPVESCSYWAAFSVPCWQFVPAQISLF